MAPPDIFAAVTARAARFGRSVAATNDAPGAVYGLQQ
jgi:hypothetical protein